MKLVFDHEAFGQNFTNCPTTFDNGIKNENQKPNLEEIYAAIFDKHIRKLGIRSEKDFRKEVNSHKSFF